LRSRYLQAFSGTGMLIGPERLLQTEEVTQLLLIRPWKEVRMILIKKL